MDISQNKQHLPLLRQLKYMPVKKTGIKVLNSRIELLVRQFFINEIRNVN